MSRQTAAFISKSIILSLHFIVAQKFTFSLIHYPVKPKNYFCYSILNDILKSWLVSAKIPTGDSDG